MFVAAGLCVAPLGAPPAILHGLKGHTNTEHLGTDDIQHRAVSLRAQVGKKIRTDLPDRKPSAKVDYHETLLKATHEALAALLMTEREGSKLRRVPTPDDAAAQFKAASDARILRYMPMDEPGEFKHEMNLDDKRAEDTGGHSSLDRHVAYLASDGEMNFEDRPKRPQKAAVPAKAESGAMEQVTYEEQAVPMPSTPNAESSGPAVTGPDSETATSGALAQQEEKLLSDGGEREAGASG